jgi:ABC-type phosphate transport system auxiliary subunit
MVDVAEIVTGILVELEGSSVFEFLEQQTASVVLAESLGVVENTRDGVVIGYELSRLIEGHAIEGNALGNEYRTFLLGIFLALSGTAVLESFLTSGKQQQGCK